MALGGGVTFHQLTSVDADRVAAAFQGFGWDNDTEVPTELDSCIGEDAPFETLRRVYDPLAGASYAIFGTNILETGDDRAFECARTMIQYFAQP